jgi:SAM-dependent methyltransferase
MSGEAPGGDVARGQELLDRFLAARGDRTRQAYSTDVADFARALDEPAAGAVARLLGGGPVAGRRLVLEYAVELRRQGRAPATVSRRLGTLRTLVNEARRLGLTEWLLETPDEDEIAAAIEERASAASYVFPRHPAEIDRLDVQHYAMREALGANHLAPVGAPRRVLDAGCGTGQWGFEMCGEFPDARVIGIDLVPGKAGRPPGYQFVKGNLLEGLPFRDDQFDLVHQRFLVAGLPLDRWRAVVADLVRTARPGGWVELVELRMELEHAGPATARLLGLALGMSAALGLDTGSVVADSLDGYLRDAGLEGVVGRELVLPFGEWGGRVGVLMATDLRAGFTRMCEVLHARSRLPLEEGMDLIQRLSDEFERHRTTLTCAIALGRKPSRRAQ